MEKITLSIPVPKIIMSVVLWFVLRHRKKKFGYTFRRIRLTKGKFAIIDPDDFCRLSQYDWHLLETKGNDYAVRFNEGIIQSMHRFIMDAPKGLLVDHHNHNGLDNRKSNLRFATHSQNCYNKKIRKKGTSKYRGVGLERKTGKWRAKIYFNGKYMNLGSFEIEEDAARAYDAAAKIYHGDFASLNFPQVSA